MAAVGALAGGPCSFGWAHFAVAVVVLVIDASSWQMANMNDRTCASARVNNFRYQVRYRAGGQGPLGVGARSICMLAHEHGSRDLGCVLTGAL